MLGWFIIISTQTPEQRDASSSSPDKEGNLASWEAGIGGTDWLNELVKQGKAARLSFGGYPSRYTAAARDVFPLIASGPPAYKGVPVIGDDYYTPGGWIGTATIDRDKIAQCPLDQQLTIDAWDQS